VRNIILIGPQVSFKIS